ncbi:MAG TPA: ROK family protein [Candidatus Saccharimonadales bacterium]|nr:ROK family protein [Candidatus Saccharimonadales bacterium]
MYVGVDIGGTKTLVAVLNDNGEIVEQVKFATPKNYDHWVLEIKNLALSHLKHQDFKAGGIGAPGYIDRIHGRMIRQPNLPWKNVPVEGDCEKIFNCPMVLENDANVAGLSEAMLHKEADSVLYVTISTGIGTGFVYKQKLDTALLDSEGGHVLIEHRGILTTWEKLSAGRMMFKHFGKKVADIDPSDKASWKYVAHHIATGLLSNIAIFQPDLVIIGGSVGEQFEYYGDMLQDELDKHKLPVVDIPKVVGAQRPSLCVIYGCYELAKQTFKHD